MPTAIPATAVVAPTGRTCFVPAASAFTSLLGESDVSRRMYETSIATMIDQKTAVIVEKPATRKTMIANSDVYWYQYRFVSSQKPGASSAMARAPSRRASISIVSRMPR